MKDSSESAGSFSSIRLRHIALRCGLRFAEIASPRKHHHHPRRASHLRHVNHLRFPRLPCRSSALLSCHRRPPPHQRLRYSFRNLASLAELERPPSRRRERRLRRLHWLRRAFCLFETQLRSCRFRCRPPGQRHGRNLGLRASREGEGLRMARRSPYSPCRGRDHLRLLRQA